MLQNHQTKNDLPSNMKQTSIGLLNKALAGMIDLALATKQAHWNVKGPRFFMIHEMLDGFRSGLDEQVDIIAERVPQLGGTALGTVQCVEKASILDPYPTDIYSGTAHILALIERYALIANLLRHSIAEADQAGDADTADIFTEASRFLDKSLWFLEAFTQAET